MQEQTSERFTKASEAQVVLETFCQKVFDALISEKFFTDPDEEDTVPEKINRLVTNGMTVFSKYFDQLGNTVDDLYWTARTEDKILLLELKGTCAAGERSFLTTSTDYRPLVDSLGSLFETNESTVISPPLTPHWNEGLASLQAKDLETTAETITNTINAYYRELVSPYLLLRFTKEDVVAAILSALRTLHPLFEKNNPEIMVRVTCFPVINNQDALVNVCIFVRYDESDDEIHRAGGVSVSYLVVEDFADIEPDIMDTAMQAFDKATPEQQRELVLSLTAEIVRISAERDLHKSKALTQALMERITQPKGS